MAYTTVGYKKNKYCIALPIASENTFGLIKLGDGLSVDEEGVVSVVGGGSDITGTDRQVVGFDDDGNQEAVTLGWKHFSDQPSPPSFNVGVLVYNQSFDEFGFGELSESPIENTIPMYRIDGTGQLSVEDGTEPLDAINLRQLEYRLPIVGSTTFTLDQGDTVFTIPHGMNTLPSSFSLTFSAGGNLEFIQSMRSIDATNITITCMAPPTGDPMIVYWQVYR